jgi:hypothetical protein
MDINTSHNNSTVIYTISHTVYSFVYFGPNEKKKPKKLAVVIKTEAAFDKSLKMY